jgi:hypothetical protein
MNGSVDLGSPDDEKVARNDDDALEIMVRHLKRDIKAMMEEGAYRRFVHQDSNLVTAVCGRRCAQLFLVLFCLNYDSKQFLQPRWKHACRTD